MAVTSKHNLPGRPWRIIHFVSTFAVKTDTKWLVQIARHLDRERFSLSAACFHASGPVRDQLESLGVATFDLGVPNEHDPRAIVRARRLIVEQQCDAVHTHLLRADLLAGLAARWVGVPIILSTVYALGKYRREKRRRTDPLLDAVCAVLPTHVIAVSEAVKQDCVERLGISVDNVSVIHTGVDLPPSVTAEQAGAFRARLNIAPNQPLILTLARLSYEKGIDTLIEAACVLRRVNAAVRWVVLGEGPDRPALEDRIRANNLDSVVCLAGFHAEVWPALAAADIVCLPSKSEGMPNVLLEAMVTGKTIVATRVGGVPEAIESERNGVLVEPENPAALAAAIGRLVGDAALARRLGKAARETAESRFGAKDVVAAYGELYRRLLERRSAKNGGAVRTG